MFFLDRRLAPEAELHPAEHGESRGHRDAQHDGRQACSMQQVDDRQQYEAHADAQVPPSPVLRLKSAHLPIVDPVLM